MHEQVYKAIASGATDLPSLAVDTSAVLALGFLVAGLLVAFGKQSLDPK